MKTVINIKESGTNSSFTYPSPILPRIGESVWFEYQRNEEEEKHKIIGTVSDIWHSVDVFGHLITIVISKTK